ncbi:helix-turn-helix domain-containing protein [Agrilactobacillus yilanensis]|uniref:Helix-turn-helix domain-containing protein n=1 Tax=Agrilactobacillus yilanensis TaxID=2485997 RepID=A0ABW4J6H0_9LACO|nr:AraC family transcriptional regulator [Agrilactobacillus yilanensis]
MVYSNDLDKLVTEYQLNNSEARLLRLPMENEKLFLMKIRQGDYRNVSFSQFDALEEKMGPLSKDRFKHFEYTTVTAISLACRAAIDGGLAPDLAYDISDTALQKLCQIKSLDEMHTLLVDTCQFLAKKVYLSRQGKSSYIIEQCKVYIQRNIFQRIKLTEISEFVGVNASYLSRIFSEKTGMTIHNYIQKQKIETACHLLKHSDRSIVDISLYLSFQSQSNFTTVFKKWVKLTPSDYRNQYRTVDFATKDKSI